MNEKMMAAVLCGDRDLQYKETDKPEPKAGEVLVRVRASGSRRCRRFLRRRSAYGERLRSTRCFSGSRESATRAVFSEPITQPLNTADLCAVVI